MKRARKNVNRTVMALVFSMIITSLVAQQPIRTNQHHEMNQEMAPPLPPGPPAPPPIPDNPDAPVAPRLDLPDLTKEQQDKIRQVDLDHMKTMTPYQNQVQEKKARLQTILATMPFDMKSADQVAEELGKIETGILKELIRHDQQLRNLLTPQQQVIFDARPKPFLRPKLNL